MIKMVSLTCPNCGASVEAEDGLNTFYCKYCGYKIVLDGQSDAAYRAKTRIKEMEHDERMVDKKYMHEKYKMKHKAKKEYLDIKIGIACMVACLTLCASLLGNSKRESDREEEELQQLVQEIQNDITNGDFNSAYIKTESIQYTEGWSDEIEDKWDNIRKEVKNQIIDAEKKATGESTHKPEKDGLFGLF